MGISMCENKLYLLTAAVPTKAKGGGTSVSDQLATLGTSTLFTLAVCGSPFTRSSHFGGDCSNDLVTVLSSLWGPF